jgi:hypothetical protein
MERVIMVDMLHVVLRFWLSDGNPLAAPPRARSFDRSSIAPCSVGD